MKGLTAGLDYRPLTDDFGLAANWRVLPEKKGGNQPLY